MCSVLATRCFAYISPGCHPEESATRGLPQIHREPGMAVFRSGREDLSSRTRRDDKVEFALYAWQTRPLHGTAGVIDEPLMQHNPSDSPPSPPVSRLPDPPERHSFQSV